jgi:hypothetical protein
MAENTGNARIFREMQSADAIRQDMRQGILDRFRESSIGQALGNAYDSDLAKGAVGGLRDAYRRVLEQGWNGKDVFDGRFHMDNQVGKPDQGGMHDMKEQYDQRASFYGWDNAPGEKEQTPEAGKERAVQEQEPEQDMGR